MSYLIAIVGLGAACIGWYWVQRLAAGDAPVIDDECGGCTACDRSTEHDHVRS